MKTWVVYSPHIFTAFEANYLSVLDKLFSTFNNPFFQKKMELFVLLPEMHCLNPFLPDALFWSPWKHQKTFGFLFSGGSKWSIGKKRVNKMLVLSKTLQWGSLHFWKPEILLFLMISIWKFLKYQWESEDRDSDDDLGLKLVPLCAIYTGRT